MPRKALARQDYTTLVEALGEQYCKLGRPTVGERNGKMTAKELDPNVGVPGCVIDGNASGPGPRGRCVPGTLARTLQK